MISKIIEALKETSTPERLAILGIVILSNGMGESGRMFFPPIVRDRLPRKLF